MKTRVASTSAKGLALVFMLALLCVFWGLGTKPIYKTQEIRVAETAREMVAGGDWLIPRYNGEVRLRKPPLAYWLTATSYLAFGKVNEFTARFASATFALLNACMIFVWLRRSLGVRTALASVACFMSSYIALRYFRSGETDSILLFFVTSACIVVYRLVYEGPNLARVLTLHLLMGLGFLTKGPAALAMPLVVLLFLSIRRREYAPLRKLAHPLGLLVLVLVAFGWYAAIYAKLPDLAAHWVGEEVEATYLGGHRVEPFYWYVPGVFSFYAPWSLFIVPAAIWLYRTRPWPPAVQLAVVWFATTFIILSLNPAKQMQYALLLNTPFAVLIGYYLANARGQFARLNRWLCFALIAVGAVVGSVLLVKAPDEMGAGAALGLIVASVLPLAFTVLLRLNLRREYPVLLLVGIMAAIWVYGSGVRYDDGSEAEVKRFSLAVKPYEPLYLYGKSNVRVSFYTERVVRALPDDQAVKDVLLQAGRPIYVATQTDVADDAHAAPTGARKVLDEGKFALWKLGVEPERSVDAKP